MLALVPFSDELTGIQSHLFNNFMQAYGSVQLINQAFSIPSLEEEASGSHIKHLAAKRALFTNCDFGGVVCSAVVDGNLSNVLVSIMLAIKHQYKNRQ